MYLSADDARSDVFFAAGVYVLGPLILSVVLGLLQVDRIAALDLVIGILLPLLVTAAVPLYLMRYRQERWSSLVAGGPADLGRGALLAAPVVVAEMLATASEAQNPLNALPVLGIVTGMDPITWIVVLLARLFFWVGLAILVVFVLRRAEDAFRMIPVYLTEEARRAALIASGVAAVITLLLVVTGARIGLLAPVAGALGAYFVAERGVGARHGSQRWTVLAPTIVAAVGVVAFAFDPGILLGTLRSAGIVATIVLAAVVSLIAGAAPRTVMVMGVVLALATSLSPMLV